MKGKVSVITPPNIGWLEKKLHDTEMDYLWKCIEKRGEGSYKSKLAGNIHESNFLIDEDGWFFKNTLTELCGIYSDAFYNLGDSLPMNQMHPYHLESFWVNYQRQNEFNPAHEHTGVYSFVVWMKIPTSHEDQNKNPISSNSNSPKISTFNFHYVDLLGNISGYTYKMNPEMEGTLVFFPGKMQHLVYPFYNCDEERISISGNISADTTKVIV